MRPGTRKGDAEEGDVRRDDRDVPTVDARAPAGVETLADDEKRVGGLSPDLDGAGAGGMLLQLLLAGTAGAAMVLKLFWRRIRAFFRRGD